MTGLRAFVGRQPLWLDAPLVQFALAAITLLLLLFGAVEVWWGIAAFHWGDAVGNDVGIYTDATRRLLSGGTWYLDRQLHGPYHVEFGDVLYPPVSIVLFAPFLVLPLFLWWALPAVIVGWMVWSERPARWTWPLIALCLAEPLVPLKTIVGNPSIWMAAFVALGLRYRWPAALVLLKPSLVPFAFVGVRSRAWWAVAALLAVGSLPFLGDTLRYPSVVLDARHDFGLLYSVYDVPMLLIPVLAWLGSTRRARSRASVD